MLQQLVILHDMLPSLDDDCIRQIKLGTKNVVQISPA